MAKINSTQDSRLALSPKEIRLINTFRKIDEEDAVFIQNMTERAAARSTKPNPFKLVPPTNLPDYRYTDSCEEIESRPGLQSDVTELLRSYDGMHPEDKLLIRDFAKARCIDHGSTKRPALQLVHN